MSHAKSIRSLGLLAIALLMAGSAFAQGPGTLKSLSSY